VDWYVECQTQVPDRWIQVVRCRRKALHWDSGKRPTHSWMSSVRSADFGGFSRLNADACQERFSPKLIG